MAKNIDISIPVQLVNFDELPPEQQQLVQQAKKACDLAYAPYSHFHVGAALLLDDGSIVIGANQENAAFSSGTCAERSACFNVGVNHKGKKIIALAIAAKKDGAFQRHPISPCGHCRQALLEFEHIQKSHIPIILYGSEAIYILPSIASTLPLCFTEF